MMEASVVVLVGGCLAAVLAVVEEMMRLLLCQFLGLLLSQLNTELCKHDLFPIFLGNVLNVLSSIDIAETRERAEKAPVKASLVSGISSPFRSTSNCLLEISSLNWHILNVDEVCCCLSTSLVQGLDEEQVAHKRAQHGKNEHSPPPSHLFRRILVYIFGGFGSLLIVAGILCCVAWKPLGQPNPQVSNLALGIVLFIVAALQAFFNAWQVHFISPPPSAKTHLTRQDWSTSRVIASISGMLPSEVVVFRGGNWLSILASELVPGDLVQVRAGNKIPADLRLCECSSDLKFNRSILTGESDAVKGSVNSTSDNFLEVFPLVCLVFSPETTLSDIALHLEYN